MGTILCKTKGNASPKGKPRLYFTCHPADFDRYFNKLCEDIFKTHDCAVYYRADMTAVIAPRDRETDLESHNLFIVPITHRLLSSPNPAMDTDLPFALEKGIAVLPFMMEPGNDKLYAEKFGELQYLSPYSTDPTEISYEEKLKKHLDAILISDEMAKQIRAAFHSYIFLSYRKRDRRYANELMRLIHSHEECRDIAVWYDEFLTPGESFRANIEKMLHDSKLFALLVTPSLLEEPEGKPNFVMGEEYPAAIKAGIDILPAEMEPTDSLALSQKFNGVPACLRPQEQEFTTRLLASLEKAATARNDPMHDFLIGLAYLDGIDMEVNRPRGLELIRSAAEQELPEAMEQLYWMYSEGKGVRLNHREAVIWAQRLVAHYEQHLGKTHEKTLVWSNDLALAYSNLGEYQKALPLHAEAYRLCCETFGNHHEISLLSLGNLALLYEKIGNYPKALELQLLSYHRRKSLWGEEHPQTLLSLQQLATVYGRLGDHRRELEVGGSAYALACKILGDRHPHTVTALGNLVACYCDLGEYYSALKPGEQVYALACLLWGEEHPNSITYLNNLALIYDQLGDPQRALEINRKVYDLRCALFGREHPDSLTALNDMAVTEDFLGQHKKAMEKHEEVYSLRRKILGESHPDTVLSLNNLAIACYNLGNYNEAAPLLKKAQDALYQVFGAKHPVSKKTADLFAILCTTYHLCPHCGGSLKGLFRKKCSLCGKSKE